MHCMETNRFTTYTGSVNACVWWLSVALNTAVPFHTHSAIDVFSGGVPGTAKNEPTLIHMISTKPTRLPQIAP